MYSLKLRSGENVICCFACPGKIRCSGIKPRFAGFFLNTRERIVQKNVAILQIVVLRCVDYIAEPAISRREVFRFDLLIQSNLDGFALSGIFLTKSDDFAQFIKPRYVISEARGGRRLKNRGGNTRSAKQNGSDA